MNDKRYLGCLLALATGVALGTTLEFQPPGTFAPIADMVGGGRFGLKPGQWTDDTSSRLFKLSTWDQLRRGGAICGQIVEDSLRL